MQTRSSQAVLPVSKYSEATVAGVGAGGAPGAVFQSSSQRWPDVGRLAARQQGAGEGQGQCGGGEAHGEPAPTVITVRDRPARNAACRRREHTREVAGPEIAAPPAIRYDAGSRPRADMHKGLIIGWLVLAFGAPAGAQELQGLDLSAPAKAEARKPTPEPTEVAPLDLTASRRPDRAKEKPAPAAPAVRRHALRRARRGAGRSGQGGPAQGLPQAGPLRGGAHPLAHR